MRCLNRKESLVVNLDCFLTIDRAFALKIQFAHDNNSFGWTNLESIPYTHTSKKDDDDFLISEDIPKYAAHNLCTSESSKMRIRLEMMQIVLDTAMNGWNLQISMGSFHYKFRFPWTLQEAEWLLDGNFRANDEAHLGKSRQKCMEDKTSLKKIKATMALWKTRTTFQGMNVGGLHQLLRIYLPCVSWLFVFEVVAGNSFVKQSQNVWSPAFKCPHAVSSSHFFSFLRFAVHCV